MDRGAWWATVHQVTESRTQLSDLACTHTKSFNVSLSEEEEGGLRHTEEKVM